MPLRFSVVKKQLPKALILIAALAMIAGSYFKIFEEYELQTYDWRAKIRGDRPTSPDIVLVEIWDDALKNIGAWPFDREVHAVFIQTLAELGVRAVAFDVLFVEPKTGDELVAETAKAAGNVYFCVGFEDIQHKNGAFRSSNLLAPVIPSYESSAKGIGHVNPHADTDGKIRKLYPSIEYGGREYLPLGLKVAEDLGLSLDLPYDEDGFFYINYAGKWGNTYKHVSYYEILRSYAQRQKGEKTDIDLDSLKGKICFVGLTALASHDTKPIPLQPIYPMVGMHANVLNSVMQRDFIHRLPRLWDIWILMLYGAVVYVFSRRWKPVQAATAVLAITLAFVLLAILLFNIWGVWLDLFYPVFSGILIYTVSTLIRILNEIRKREVLENELKIASKIQQSFLPETVPQVPDLEIAVFMRPAKAVGGDLYTFVPLAEGKLGVMVGDVSGKGTPAALFMAKCVSEFKFSARDRMDPADVLNAFNNAIASEATGGLFVTLTYMIFDGSTQKFVMADGGHLPIIAVHKDGTFEQLNAEQGMPIGVTPDVPFSVVNRAMVPGDIWALYSDGVSEARNRRKDEYSVERLQELMAAHKERSAQEILDLIIADLHHFMQKADQHDDITLMIVKYVANSRQK